MDCKENKFKAPVFKENNNITMDTQRWAVQQPKSKTSRFHKSQNRTVNTCQLSLKRYWISHLCRTHISLTIASPSPVDIILAELLVNRSKILSAGKSSDGPGIGYFQNILSQFYASLPMSRSIPDHIRE